MNLPQAVEQTPPTDTAAPARSRRSVYAAPFVWGLAAVMTFTGVMFIPGFPGNPNIDRPNVRKADVVTPKGSQSTPISDIQRLAEAVERLTADRDKLITRLELLERQIGAKPLAQSLMAKPLEPIITGSIGSTIPASSAADAMPMMDGPVRHIAFAIDLGAAPTVDRLKDRWLAMKELYGPTLGKLEPKIAFGRTKDGEVELRLLAGPFRNAQSAVETCASLQSSAICEPRPFEGEALPKS